MNKKRDLSIIIPTYNEKENILNLTKKILLIYKENKINGEIIIVDDNSPDGTGKILDQLAKKNKSINVLHRKGKLGLSSAVLEGFAISNGNVVGVMDADLSHPAEKIPEMLKSIKDNKADLAIGSRYVKNGKIVGWNLKRKIMSKTATLMARVFTPVKDPMSGFFMIKKDLLDDRELNPKGFKILLEIILKTKNKKVIEIPITFIDRKKGKSKAGFKEIFYYIGNLLNYLPYKKKVIKEFLFFALVGLTGTVLNLLILYLLTNLFGVYYLISATVAFIFATTSNFILNKVITFREKLKDRIGSKYFKFFFVSIIGLGFNLLFLFLLTEYFKIQYLISQIIALSLVMIFNFIGNKFFTFR